MFGRIGNTYLIGLPGNPVSSLVCALIFVAPALRSMLGMKNPMPQPLTAILGSYLPENDEREDYLRAKFSRNDSGELVATPFDKQDSSMFATIAQSDALVIRAPFAAAARPGDLVEIIALDGSVYSI